MPTWILKTLFNAVLDVLFAMNSSDEYGENVEKLACCRCLNENIISGTQGHTGRMRMLEDEVNN